MSGVREQRRVTFTGHVQGVGFRYTTKNLASGFDVTGYVKNLSDGGVELLCQGLPSEMDAFLTEVRRHFGGQIREEKTDASPVGEAYRGFEIRY
jgi:acylphosphatase